MKAGFQFMEIRLFTALSINGREGGEAATYYKLSRL